MDFQKVEGKLLEPVDGISRADRVSIADRFYAQFEVREARYWGSCSWAVLHPYVVIGATVYVTEVLLHRNPLVLFVAILIIYSRQTALYLAGHEGVHGTLLPTSRPSKATNNGPGPRLRGGVKAQLNDFLARWLCLFPLGISLSRYRLNHQLHHGMLGTQGDPDRNLYAAYPRPWSSTLKFYVKELLTGRLPLGFVGYYNELLSPEAWHRRRPGSDHLVLAFGWILTLALLFASGWSEMFLIYWVLPWFVGMPLHHFMGALQHGAFHLDSETNLRSRSIDGPSWALELILPLNLRFHAEHHMAPMIPYCDLPEFSQWLDVQNVTRRHQGLKHSLLHLHQDLSVPK